MDDVIKPVRLFGWVLIMGGVITLLWGGGVLFFNPSSPAYILGVKKDLQLLLYFWAACTILFISTGVGIVLQKRWGYILFKFFLYLMVLGFPIGTIISYKTLAYMRQHQLKRSFGFTESL
jgi:hypothetical protein